MYISYFLGANIGNKNRYEFILLYRKLWCSKLMLWNGVQK